MKNNANIQKRVHLNNFTIVYFLVRRRLRRSLKLLLALASTVIFSYGPRDRSGKLLLGLASSAIRVSSEDAQSRQTVKYGLESRGARNQESLCWRGPAAI
jgi:hypothetical protein